MGRIILAVPNTQAGEVALNHLTQQSSVFGATFEGTLGDDLSQQAFRSEKGTFDRLLDHTYVRLMVAEQDEFTTIDRILDFHNNPRAQQGDSSGFVQSGDLDRPMRPALTPASTGAIGVPIDLSAGKHSDYVRQLNVPAAHSRGVRGSGVRVAIIDTGIEDWIIPSPVKIEEYHDVVNDKHYAYFGPGATYTVADPNGHGSAMAMVISDVAPDAKLYVIKICDNDPKLWDAMAGFGQALYVGAEVISFAIGFTTTANLCCTCGASGKTQSDIFKLFLDNIAALDPTQGLMVDPPVVVAPTRNETSARGFLYPAGYESVIAVGSVDSGGTRSLFSNYGTLHSTYLMAPGGQEDSSGTITEYVGEDSTGVKFYGTSPAVAYTAATIALIKSDKRFSFPSRSFLIDKVRNNCSPKPTNVNEQKEYGEGVLGY